MNIAPVSIALLPLLWVGVVGTSLSFAVREHNGRRVRKSAGPERARATPAAALTVYAGWTIAAASAVAWLLTRAGVTSDALRLGGRLPLFDVFLACSGAALGIGLWPVAERLATRLASSTPRPLLRPVRFRVSDARDNLTVAIVGVVIVPTLEEWLFRGYALTTLQQRTGSALAATILVSAAFASIHVPLGRQVVTYAFLVSFPLSAIVLWRGSLYPAVLMHCLINLIAFFVLPLIVGGRRPQTEMTVCDG